MLLNGMLHWTHALRNDLESRERCKKSVTAYEDVALGGRRFKHYWRFCCVPARVQRFFIDTKHTRE